LKSLAGSTCWSRILPRVNTLQVVYISIEWFRMIKESKWEGRSVWVSVYYPPLKSDPIIQWALFLFRKKKRREFLYMPMIGSILGLYHILRTLIPSNTSFTYTFMHVFEKSA
jgi:hypothetical protein